MKRTKPYRELPHDAVLTGSRAFGVAAGDSDWDYVSQNNPPNAKRWDRQDYGIGDGYMVFRAGNLNLIVCLSADAHYRWMQAHKHCVIERPKSKDRRRVIFDHYMHGTPLDAKRPINRLDRAWFDARKPHRKG